MDRTERGRLGGMATLRRHGRDHMQRIGRMGGRPRSLPVPIKEKEGELPNDLFSLKALWRTAGRAGTQNTRAGGLSRGPSAREGK